MMHTDNIVDLICETHGTQVEPLRMPRERG